jgi:hypothetical protein
MSLFDDASLVLTPNGVKSGKVYSIKPTDGVGDFDFTRASLATRVKSDGLIEEVSTGVPRLDYPPLGGCPSLLVEPQRTNLFLQDLSGAGIVTRTVTVVNGTQYSVSVYGSGSMTLSGAGTGTVTDGSHVTFTASSTSLTLTLSGSLDYCQVEAGAYPTSIIFTELATETRNADVISKTGISSLIGQSEGFILFKPLFNDATEIHVLGQNLTVTNQQVKIEYSASQIKFYLDDVLVSTKNGTFDFSSMDEIEIGNYLGGSQLGGHISNFVTI